MRMWRLLRLNHRGAFFFFRRAPGCNERRSTNFRLKPGLSILRRGAGAVVTPIAPVASKEDVGKGGASPAPLPEILGVYRGKAWSEFRGRFVRGTGASGRRLEKSP